jgi:hypothetical protein
MVGKSMKKNGWLSTKYIVLMSLYWSLAAVSYSFMTPILEEKGFSGFEIGMVSFFKFLAVIVFQIIIGKVVSRYRQGSLNHIMMGMVLLSVGAALFLYYFNLGLMAMIEGCPNSGTKAATSLLVEKGVLYGPAKAVYAGHSNAAAFALTKRHDMVDEYLKVTMKDVYTTCKVNAKKYGYKGQLDAGANIAGFEKAAAHVMAGKA